MRLLSFPATSVLPEESAELVVAWPFDPGRLRYLRIYEARSDADVSSLLRPVIDRDSWDVIRDALIDQRYDRAHEIVSGIAGPWRPSTIIISTFSVYRRVLVNDTIARALWNLDFNHEVLPAVDLRLFIRNDATYERFIRAHVVVADDILDDDLMPTP